MRRGRKPIPTAIKKLAGNPGKRPLNAGEPRFEAPGSLQEPPAWLDPIAKDEYRRLAPHLASLGMLTVVDRGALTAYCKAFSRWMQAEAVIDKANSLVFKTPAGYPQQLPHISVAQKYLQIMNGLATEFGFTPASRARVQAGDPARGIPTQDDESFFGPRTKGKSDDKDQEQIKIANA